VHAELLERVEKSGHEPADSLLEYLAELLVERGDEEYCYKTYWITDEVPIVVAESRAIISKGTTGLTSWDSGKLFAEYIAENAGEFDGKNVVELGCGPGLVASAMQRLCHTRRMVVTDLDAEVLRLAVRNVELSKGYGNLDPDGESGVTLNLIIKCIPWLRTES
jgi:predicted nicotinamide N-methyase